MNTGRGRNRGGRNPGWRGRSPPSGAQYVVINKAVGSHSGDASLTPGSGSGNTGKRNQEIATSVDLDGVTQKFNDVLSSPAPNSTPYRVGNRPSNAGNCKQAQDFIEAKQVPKLIESRSVAPGHHNDIPALSSCQIPVTRATLMGQSCDEKEEICKEEPQNLDSSFQVNQVPREVQRENINHTGTGKKVDDEDTHSQNKKHSFDICEERDRKVPRLKPALHVKNKAARNEMKRRMQGENIETFESCPGMILLKSYIPLKDQVKLIKSCRVLGRGPGGFYQPSYRDGATLHLKMMCLGKHWDPETSKYHDERPIDDVKPPPIPDEFQRLVKQSIQECHDYLEFHSKGNIPSMSPNICIINFYTKTGRLGLHQDKDESKESLAKGLPVVSFSLGDSADFLFGNQRDVENAEKVTLESGDVLVFGGASRLIFHGVSSILPDTAPKELLEETNLKPGRLNLTFRQY